MDGHSSPVTAYVAPTTGLVCVNDTQYFPLKTQA